MPQDRRGLNDSRELLIIDGPRVATGTIRISGARNSLDMPYRSGPPHGRESAYHEFSVGAREYEK